VTSIIIPSRKVENLRPCIQAIDKYDSTADIRIIVVDDGLSEKPPQWIREIECQVVQGAKPFVFSRNCNLGVCAAGEDDVILLNDDCLLTTEGGFTALIGAANEHPEFGLISAAVNNTGNPNQRPRNAGLREEPRMVCFVAVYIHRKTIDSVGLLDDRFTAYGFDDDDYCLRVRKSGLKLGVFDGCVMDHSTLESTFRGKAAGNLEAGVKIFMRKWGHDHWGRSPMRAMR
jgi:GT2 family glycosyltransferase